MKNNENNALEGLRYFVSCKLTWAEHTHLQEISSKTGKPIFDTLRDIINLGIDAWLKLNKGCPTTPMMNALHDMRRIRQNQAIHDMLATLKWELTDDQFRERCTGLGMKPEDFDDVPPPAKKRTKRDYAEQVLQLLLTDRPDGLPGTRVLEITGELGFGENMIREVANDIGVVKQRRKVNGKRASVWRLPVSSNFTTLW